MLDMLVRPASLANVMYQNDRDENLIRTGSTHPAQLDLLFKVARTVAQRHRNILPVIAYSVVCQQQPNLVCPVRPPQCCSVLQQHVRPSRVGLVC
jgi:hypothetical protein